MKEKIYELLSKNVGVNVTIEECQKIRLYIEELEDDQDFLRALEIAGVDNWNGYEYACRIYNGEEE